MRLHPALLATVAACVSASAIATVISCASTPDRDRVTGVIEPDFDSYQQHVDAYLTRRCGTLDCHGQAGRAYRIYSREGYRLVQDGSFISGVQPTTPAETRANFQALVGLEPEEMTRLMARQGENPNILLFLRKPLLGPPPGFERHKGGRVMAEDDPGYRCVLAWLNIRVVDGEGNFIEPKDRDKLSGPAIARCDEAAGIP